MLPVATATLSDSPAVQQQYLAQLALTAALAQGLHNLWPVANPLTDPAKFRRALGALVGQLSQVSASIASDFYLGVRAEAGVTGAPPTLRLVPPAPQSKVDAGIEWAMRHREEMQRTEAEILDRAEAAMQKAIADAGREQIVTAVEGDQFAIGYRRVPRPDACYWCIVQAIRKTQRSGLAITATSNARRNTYDPNIAHYGVYKSRASAGQIPANAQGDTNRFHNNCHCVVEPVFFPINKLPDWLHGMETLYADSTVGSRKGEQLNDFRRTLAAHRNGETPPTPAVPTLVTPAANTEQINALLNLFAAA